MIVGGIMGALVLPSLSDLCMIPIGQLLNKFVCVDYSGHLPYPLFIHLPIP
jgi:hypothetical protein